MLISVVLLWIGARQVLVDHSLSGADLIAFLVLVMRLLQPLKQITSVPASAQSSLASAERLFEILDTPTEQELDTGAQKVTAFQRDLVFEHVGFAYDDKPVLSDVNLSAARGEVIALVGASGAGKSTLVDLIPRFYEPTSGRILLDGVDTRAIQLPAATQPDGHR